MDTQKLKSKLKNAGTLGGVALLIIFMMIAIQSISFTPSSEAQMTELLRQEKTALINSLVADREAAIVENNKDNLRLQNEISLLEDIQLEVNKANDLQNFSVLAKLNSTFQMDRK